jgi:hypothetical protein
LSLNGLTWFWVTNAAELEELSVLLGVKLLRVLIHSLNVESAAESSDWLVWRNLVTGQVVVTNKAETWLVNVVSEW